MTVGLDARTAEAYVNMLGYGACVFASPPYTSVAHIPQLVFEHLAVRLPAQVMDGVLRDQRDLAAGANDVGQRVNNYAEDGSTLSTRDDATADCSRLQVAFLRKAAPLLPALSHAERAALASSDEAVFLAAAANFIERAAQRPRIVIECELDSDELPNCIADRSIDVVVARSNGARSLQRVGATVDPRLVDRDFAVHCAETTESAWHETVKRLRLAGRQFLVEWPDGYGIPQPTSCE